MSDEETKILLKQALKEWLDEKISEFGWFALKTIGALAFAALVYFMLSMNGWHK